MTFWRDVFMMNPPSAVLGKDEAQRHRLSFNVLVVKRPSATFDEEALSVLAAAAVGTKAKDLFGAGASVPIGDGPFTQVTPTGGPGGIRTHNAAPRDAYHQATMQVVVRARDYAAAKAKAHAALNALCDVKNRDVSP